MTINGKRLPLFGSYSKIGHNRIRDCRSCASRALEIEWWAQTDALRGHGSLCRDVLENESKGFLNSWNSFDGSISRIVCGGRDELDVVTVEILRVRVDGEVGR